MTDTTAATHTDRRRWLIDTVTRLSLKNGDVHVVSGRIEVDADKHTTRPGFEHGRSSMAAIVDLLWIDAGPRLPWTPSAVNEVVLHREHDTITYRRAGRAPDRDGTDHDR